MTDQILLPAMNDLLHLCKECTPFTVTVALSCNRTVQRMIITAGAIYRSFSSKANCTVRILLSYYLAKFDIMSGIFYSYQHAKLRLCQESFPPISIQSWDYVSNPYILSAAKLRLCQESFPPIIIHS